MARKCVRVEINSGGTLPSDMKYVEICTRQNGVEFIGVTNDDSSYTGIQEFTTKSSLTAYLTNNLGSHFSAALPKVHTAAELSSRIWGFKNA